MSMSSDEDEPRSEFAAQAMANLCRGLHTMRMEKELCDLQVTVGGQTFHCHLLVLASVSGFFRSLTSSSWRENHAGKVTLDHDDVTAESFQMFLDILYQSKDVVTIDTATDILRMSIFLQVKFLEQHCIDFLIRNITPDICVGIWMFAEKYQLPQLAYRIFTMACEEMDKVVESDEILQLPKSMLLVLLSGQRKLSMDDTCRTILRWVEADAEDRQVCFQELLPFVSFPQLSPGYIHELMNYFDHPFFKHMNKKIREAVSFNLQNQTPEVQRQILGQQDRVTDSPLIQRCAVVLGACSTDDTKTQDVTAFQVEPGTKWYSFTLQDFPEPFDRQFAACVHGNELYVSRGNEKKTSLAKYVPGCNEWETLPELKFRLEKHSMCAVGDRIYLIGGSKMPKKKQHDVSCYDIRTKMVIHGVMQLQVGVEDAATTVVGHRLYVLGGRDGQQKPVNAVQCVDTRSGQVYLSGGLPSPAEDITALSDGGTVFLVCDGARVLRMKEHFELADRKESALKQKPITTAENSTSAPSVSFVDVGSFGGGKVVSAYLHKGEMVGCGTVSSDGQVSPGVQAMDLTTGEVAKKRLAFQKPLKNFKLCTLNIPREFLNEEKAVGCFQPGDNVRWNPSVPVPTTYQSYNNYYGNNTHVTLSTGETGTVQSIDANGTVTTAFQMFGNYTSPASSLCFV